MIFPTSRYINNNSILRDLALASGKNIGIGHGVKTLLVGTIFIVFGVSLLLLVIRMILSLIRKKLETYIADKFDKKEIIGATTGANFFGVESKGGKQIRGNGALVLTKDTLFFVRAVPEKEYAIPIANIVDITLPTSFNGKSVLSKLLCVHYRDDVEMEAIAWAIKNPEKWKDAIDRLIIQAT